MSQTIANHIDRALSMISSIKDHRLDVIRLFIQEVILNQGIVPIQFGMPVKLNKLLLDIIILRYKMGPNGEYLTHKSVVNFHVYYSIFVLGLSENTLELSYQDRAFLIRDRLSNALINFETTDGIIQQLNFNDDIIAGIIDEIGPLSLCQRVPNSKVRALVREIVQKFEPLLSESKYQDLFSSISNMFPDARYEQLKPVVVYFTLLTRAGSSISETIKIPPEFYDLVTIRDSSCVVKAIRDTVKASPCIIVKVDQRIFQVQHVFAVQCVVESSCCFADHMQQNMFNLFLNSYYIITQADVMYLTPGVIHALNFAQRDVRLALTTSSQQTPSPQPIPTVLSQPFSFPISYHIDRALSMIRSISQDPIFNGIHDVIQAPIMNDIVPVQFGIPIEEEKLLFYIIIIRYKMGPHGEYLNELLAFKLYIILMIPGLPTDGTDFVSLIPNRLSDSLISFETAANIIIQLDFNDNIVAGIIREMGPLIWCPRIPDPEVRALVRQIVQRCETLFSRSEFQYLRNEIPLYKPTHLDFITPTYSTYEQLKSELIYYALSGIAIAERINVSLEFHNLITTLPNSFNRLSDLVTIGEARCIVEETQRTVGKLKHVNNNGQVVPIINKQLYMFFVFFNSHHIITRKDVPYLTPDVIHALSPAQRAMWLKLNRPPERPPLPQQTPDVSAQPSSPPISDHIDCALSMTRSISQDRILNCIRGFVQEFTNQGFVLVQFGMPIELSKLFLDLTILRYKMGPNSEYINELLDFRTHIILMVPGLSINDRNLASLTQKSLSEVIRSSDQDFASLIRKRLSKALISFEIAAGIIQELNLNDEIIARMIGEMGPLSFCLRISDPEVRTLVRKKVQRFEPLFSGSESQNFNDSVLQNLRSSNSFLRSALRFIMPPSSTYEQVKSEVTFTVLRTRSHIPVILTHEFDSLVTVTEAQCVVEAVNCTVGRSDLIDRSIMMLIVFFNSYYIITREDVPYLTPDDIKYYFKYHFELFTPNVIGALSPAQRAMWLKLTQPPERPPSPQPRPAAFNPHNLFYNYCYIFDNMQLLDPNVRALLTPEVCDVLGVFLTELITVPENCVWLSDTELATLPTITKIDEWLSKISADETHKIGVILGRPDIKYEEIVSRTAINIFQMFLLCVWMGTDIEILEGFLECFSDDDLWTLFPYFAIFLPELTVHEINSSNIRDAVLDFWVSRRQEIMDVEIAIFVLQQIGWFGQLQVTAFTRARNPKYQNWIITIMDAEMFRLYSFWNLELFSEFADIVQETIITKIYSVQDLHDLFFQQFLEPTCSDELRTKVAQLVELIFYASNPEIQMIIITKTLFLRFGEHFLFQNVLEHIIYLLNDSDDEVQRCLIENLFKQENQNILDQFSPEARAQVMAIREAIARALRGELREEFVPALPESQEEALREEPVTQQRPR